MIAVLQRVTQAQVKVEDSVVGEIDKGIMLLLAIEPSDNKENATRLANKVAKYRMFNDAQGKMNLNVQQIGGDVLVVSQFTLAADTSKGLRPSFTSAASPDVSRHLYQYFCQQLRENNMKVPTGIFGADMQVSLINDGPVTFKLTC